MLRVLDPAAVASESRPSAPRLRQLRGLRPLSARALLVEAATLGVQRQGVVSHVSRRPRQTPAPHLDRYRARNARVLGSALIIIFFVFSWYSSSSCAGSELDYSSLNAKVMMGTSRGLSTDPKGPKTVSFHRLGAFQSCQLALINKVLDGWTVYYYTLL